MLDVLGRDLEYARAALEAAGYQIEVVETRTSRAAGHPTRERVPGGSRGVTLTGALRVVRQQQGTDRLVRLVVTHERYVPAG